MGKKQSSGPNTEFIDLTLSMGSGVTDDTWRKAQSLLLHSGQPCMQDSTYPLSDKQPWVATAGTKAGTKLSHKQLIEDRAESLAALSSWACLVYSTDI
ncbi:uncharacterized protein N7496_009092 [Penicillium cataractarum]|uniref:Uncharacterized protein n=1 Tax=Penicillium cataractarum TaxID=2100454 RepID=A0A9W9S087_9EURO|nr:uncharacterized protein N7496_009092 [Penicillium cataractarum]KAJ5369332.1 hypothetical protein N7496_009092 [Penicillium cataractarum]